MQPDRFTVKSQEALAAAQRVAAARGNSQVAPYHLLLALLEQDGGIVVPVLRRANADPESVRRRANEALDALPTVTGDAQAEPTFDSALSDLLRRADDEARGMGDEYVSTEHLLAWRFRPTRRSTWAPPTTSSRRRCRACAGRIA